VSLANGVRYVDQQGSVNPETAAYDVSDDPFWSSHMPVSTFYSPPIVTNGILYIANITSV
jgi:hypothetical protein